MKHLKDSSSQRFHCLAFFSNTKKGGKQWGVVMWVNVGCPKSCSTAIPCNSCKGHHCGVKICFSEKQENSRCCHQDSVFPRVFAWMLPRWTNRPAYNHCLPQYLDNFGFFVARFHGQPRGSCWRKQCHLPWVSKQRVPSYFQVYIYLSQNHGVNEAWWAAIGGEDFLLLPFHASPFHTPTPGVPWGWEGHDWNEMDDNDDPWWHDDEDMWWEPASCHFFMPPFS